MVKSKEKPHFVLKGNILAGKTPKNVLYWK